MLLVIQKRVPTHGTINKGGQEESCYLQHIFVIMKSLVSIRINGGIGTILPRVCHQMTKREARDAMQRYLLQHFSDSVDLDAPIKVKVQATK